MSATNFDELIVHKGHETVVVAYGDYYDPDNVAIECINCGEVLLDYDREEEE